MLHGDTAIAPKGMDTYGSRSLAVGGTAIVNACDKVRHKARRHRGAMLEVSADDLDVDRGPLVGPRRPGPGQAASARSRSPRSPRTTCPTAWSRRSTSDATYDPDNFSFPHGTHLCAAEVDTETGQVRIRSYVAVDDVGMVINPLIVEGQVHGGIAQGMAQALYEEAVYDA